MIPLFCSATANAAPPIPPPATTIGPHFDASARQDDFSTCAALLPTQTLHVIPSPARVSTQPGRFWDHPKISQDLPGSLNLNACGKNQQEEST